MKIDELMVNILGLMDAECADVVSDPRTTHLTGRCAADVVSDGGRDVVSDPRSTHLTRRGGRRRLVAWHGSSGLMRRGLGTM